MKRSELIQSLTEGICTQIWFQMQITKEIDGMVVLEALEQVRYEITEEWVNKHPETYLRLPKA